MKWWSCPVPFNEELGPVWWPRKKNYARPSDNRKHAGVTRYLADAEIGKEGGEWTFAE
jgi:hypothetical protein